MVKLRRSKRKSVKDAYSTIVVDGGNGQYYGGSGSCRGRVRRSARKRAHREMDEKIYGTDYGILPSD